MLTQALRFELGKPVDLDEWTLARKRLYDTNVFRLVDIQPLPVGDPENGVQQVKAVVTVEECPSGRCATASRSKASVSSNSMSSRARATPGSSARSGTPTCSGAR